MLHWGMRTAVLLIALASACLAPAAEPREDFLRIDRPLALGYARVQERLEAVRALRPTVGLHLSGGSARAFAHLGVLRRLEEEGLYPDVIVTNSMGSVIGLLYAAGVPLDVIEDIFQYIDFGKLFTLKLPTAGGLADLRGLSALLQALVGEADVAGLPIPVVVVCEDLVSMRRVLVAEGPFGEVLRAAIAIPALFEPVELEGFTLIDGGITNLVPLEPFAGLNEAVISATAFYNRDLEPKDPFTIFTMAVNIGKSRTAVQDLRRYQPLLIRTDVEEFSFMGWHQLARIQGRGYDSCSERIGELRSYLQRAGVPLPAAGPPRRGRGALPAALAGHQGPAGGRPEPAAAEGLPMPCSSIRWCCAGTGGPTGWCRTTSPRPATCTSRASAGCASACQRPGFPARRLSSTWTHAPWAASLLWNWRTTLSSPWTARSAGPLQLPSAARQPGTGRGRLAFRRAFPAGRAPGAAAGRRAGGAGGRRPAGAGRAARAPAPARSWAGFGPLRRPRGWRRSCISRQPAGRPAARLRPGPPARLRAGDGGAGLQRFLPGDSPLGSPGLLRRVQCRS